MAASEAGAMSLTYHTFGDPRSAPLVELSSSLRGLDVGTLWALVRHAAQKASIIFPPPTQKREFMKCMQTIATSPTELAALLEPATGESSSSGGDVHVAGGGLEGKSVLYQGSKMTCIKQTCDGRVRLQESSGTTIWRSLADVVIAECKK
jgi:hypothetical protein